MGYCSGGRTLIVWLIESRGTLDPKAIGRLIRFSRIMEEAYLA